MFGTAKIIGINNWFVYEWLTIVILYYISILRAKIVVNVGCLHFVCVNYD